MRAVLPAALLLVMGGAPRSSAAPVETGPQDAAYREALQRLYDGRLEEALDGLARLSARQPADPVGAYLEALAFCWKVEQRPEIDSLDGELERRLDRALALADGRLREDPQDARALLARGAAHGVRSRYHLFRSHRTEAARAAVRMREDLLEVRRLDPGSKDALFGLGLYEYYADVLPRLAKVLRFLARMPGGDRRRGLSWIEQAREGSLFHATEVQVQLYEIYAFYEGNPDRALAEIAELNGRYPGWPLWGLKRAEHLRDRLGLYGESAQVAGAILEKEGAPGPRTLAAAMARLSRGESLLLDLRLGEARQELLPLRDGFAGAPSLRARARLMLGRCLELEGDRDAALAHYRIAVNSADRELRRRAQGAVSAPLPTAQVRATSFIALARRLREAGRPGPAADAYRQALELWPRSPEAALRVAEDEIAHGRAESARRWLTTLARDENPQPPWVRPWSLLLLGRLHDLEGERARAVVQYKKVLEEPYGQEELRVRAREGLRRPFTGNDQRSGPALPASIYPM